MTSHPSRLPYNDQWLANATQASGRPQGAVAHSVDRRTGIIGHVSVHVPLGRAVRSVGHAIDPVATGIGRGVEQLEDKSLEVPVVGGLLHGTLVLSEFAFAGPFIISYQVAHGKRIDRAALGQLSRQLKAVREVAPYAQAVVAYVPGVGPGVSAGIAVGLALSSGKPIDQALVKAVRDAIPGGPLGQIAFDMGRAAMSGKPLDEVLSTGAMDGLQAAGVPPSARSALRTGLDIAAKISRGEPVDQIMADTALDALRKLPGVSPTAAKLLTAGIQTGIAIAHGQHLQLELTTVIPDAIDALVEHGEREADRDPLIDAASSLIDDESADAFYAAVGLMQHNAGSVEITATRAAFDDPADVLAFDIGLCIHIGEVTHKSLPAGLTPPALAGYLLVKGMRGATEEQRVAMIEQIKDKPEPRRGAIVALKEVAATRADKPWWISLKAALGFDDTGARP